MRPRWGWSRTLLTLSAAALTLTLLTLIGFVVYFRKDLRMSATTKLLPYFPLLFVNGLSLCFVLSRLQPQETNEFAPRSARGRRSVVR